MREHIRDKANEQCVRTFVADQWTLEYDLAYFGLGKEMYVARALAEADDKINDKKATVAEVEESAGKDYDKLAAMNLPKEELCTFIYEPFAVSNPVSKPIAAQYLADILQAQIKGAKLTQDGLRALLPPYLVEAIVHVTEPFSQSADNGAQETASPAQAGKAKSATALVGGSCA